MIIKEVKTKIYICEVCGAVYEDDEKLAIRCEKLPVEEKKFKKGDKVEIDTECQIVGEISAVRLYSPVDNDDMTARFGILRKTHFYLYDVKVSNIGATATFPAHYLKKLKT